MNDIATISAPARGDVEPSGGGVVSSPFDRLIAAATDPAVDVDKMERLLGVAERWKAQEARASYARALASMQPDLPEVKKRGSAGDRYKYALWEDIQDSLRPVLAEHGFSLSFRTESSDRAVTVTAVLLHEDGHSEPTSLTVPFDASGGKNAVQAMGSATSYGKRYTSQALLNLTARGEDDDGQAAGNPAPPTLRQADEGELVSTIAVMEMRELLRSIGRTDEQFIAYANNRLGMNIKRLDEMPARFVAEARSFLDVIAKKVVANG